MEEYSGNNINFRISRRSNQEQRIRDKLALVFRKERAIENEGKEIPNRLKKKKSRLEAKKHNIEIESMSKFIDTDQFNEYDVKFLEGLSNTDLCKIEKYNRHRMRDVAHIYSDGGGSPDMEYPYYPKYTFLYELCVDKPLIGESLKLKLKEKAESEVWQMVCKEIEGDTILYRRRARFVGHIFDYIPQKIFANKLRWTGNRHTSTNIDVLIENLDLFTDLCDKYINEVKREYNGDDEDNEDNGNNEDGKKENSSNEGENDNYIESRESVIRCALEYIEREEKRKRRFYDWLRKEYGDTVGERYYQF